MKSRHYVGALVFGAILGGMPAWVWGQVPFPARGVEIINELYAGTNPQDDNARRVAIHRVCSQMVAELGPSWGNKKRTGLSDDFRSPDSIAYLEPDGFVSVWDVQASSGAILVHAGKGPDYPRLSPGEATFMPCAPMNYLNPAPPPAPIPPQAVPPVSTIPQPAIDLSGVEQQIAELTTKLDGHIASTEAFQAQARGVWSKFFQPVLEFTAKYVLPAVGGWLIGQEAAK